MSSASAAPYENDIQTTNVKRVHVAKATARPRGREDPPESRRPQQWSTRRDRAETQTRPKSKQRYGLDHAPRVPAGTLSTAFSQMQ